MDMGRESDAEAGGPRPTLMALPSDLFGRVLTEVVDCSRQREEARAAGSQSLLSLPVTWQEKHKLLAAPRAARLALANKQCRQQVSSIPGWKSCSCCGSDLQQDALAAKGADKAGAESYAASDLALGRLCADPDCFGFLCQGCAKSACACKKCDLRFCARCSVTPKPQEWWEEQDDLKAGTDGKLISACSGCLGVFCAKESCATTTCSECSHIGCKECDETYVCRTCGDAWCVRCRDPTRCAHCKLQQCRDCSDAEEYGGNQCGGREGAGCGKPLCEGCGIFDKACLKSLCLGCAKFCATCDFEMCQDCAKTCATCEKEMCQDCVFTSCTTLKCGQVVCSTACAKSSQCSICGHFRCRECMSGSQDASICGQCPDAIRVVVKASEEDAPLFYVRGGCTSWALEIKMSQNLDILIKRYCSHHKYLDPTSVGFRFNEAVLDGSETPQSLGMKAGDVISVELYIFVTVTPKHFPSSSDEAAVFDESRERLAKSGNTEFRIAMHDKLSKLMHAYPLRHGTEAAGLSFYFKDVKLKGSETPALLRMSSRMFSGANIICCSPSDFDARIKALHDQRPAVTPARLVSVPFPRSWLLPLDVPRAVCPYCKKDMGQPSSLAALCSSLNGHFNHPANVECRAARLDACKRAARYEQ